MALITLKLFDLRSITKEAHRYLEFLANGAYDRTENANKEKFVLKLFVAFCCLALQSNLSLFTYVNSESYLNLYQHE